MPHILVVDDDELIRNLIENILERAGYRVSLAEDGPSLRAVLEQETVDLILLDIRLGRDHGFDLARDVTERSRIPIIFVTGDREVASKVTGLEIGAEDYITKPFDQRELLARIRVSLRRHTGGSEGAGRRLLFNDFVLHLDAHELRGPDGGQVDLTKMELQILACLAKKPRQTLSRNEISLAVSGRPRDRRDRTIDVVVSKLRRKIESAARCQTDSIQTVRGVGYKFVADVRTA